MTICGDGRVIDQEICDDGNKNDNRGCKNDCSGIIDGWNCNNHTYSYLTTTCFEICDDGLIVGFEVCDDN